MISEITIEESDAISLLNMEENHFFDITNKDVSGRGVQRKCCAFANSDGGELVVGIEDLKNSNSNDLSERWKGFSNQEEANDLILNIFRNITPGIENHSFEFISIKNKEEIGKILKIYIEKSHNVHETSDKKVWVRKGAQCIEIKGDEIFNLKLAKGYHSYENQAIGDYDLPELYEAKELLDFLQEYSPKTTPEDFLKKQKLIKKNDDNGIPVCAGILLYDDNPSASLPKKCAIKISRYNTSNEVPNREHLERQETIEGPLYEQIERSIKIIKMMIESVPVMTPDGLGKAKYPPEAIKEVLVNAVIHRDYNMSDDILAFVFNNRIEIISPGGLPGYITTDNILYERFARNNKIVRLLNKYPDAPNKDIGEGLNTAFQKMKEMRLKEPTIEIKENRVIVILPHQSLAAPEEQILKYLKSHNEIDNKTAREITGIGSENTIKQQIFYKLKKNHLIEMVPDKKGSKSAWRLKRL